MSLRIVVILALLCSGCAHKKPVAPAIDGFSIVAPRHCLQGDGPKWTPDSYCRQVMGKWTCHKMKADIKTECGSLEVVPQ